ncbi:MAG: hypothetical protein WC344_05365 [Bacilli bacterium]|jgi:hypothetical protein
MGQVIFNKDLGPVAVYWNSILIGPVVGGVKLKIEAKAVEIKEDAYGAMPADAVFVGLEVPDIEIPIGRFTMAQMETLTKGGTLVGSVLSLANPVGEAMYADAKPLQFRPLVNAVPSAVTTEYITVLKTYPIAAWEIPYDNATQRIHKVKFKVFIKQESPNIYEVLTLGE